ncbi:MAG: FAD-dependent oxidoreductase [Thermomicrobiales bacterium]|nr:FAD-dependent oxidoreductase [Thermomicrobiales bacterium]
MSFWLETAGDLTPRPRLDGSVDVDVAILGAGYTGLWTAYYLQQQDPARSIAVIEKEIAGYGASGRNGGWCSPGFPVSLGMLRERYGPEQARAQTLAMHEAVREVGRVAAAENIDAQFTMGGGLRLARGRSQEPSIRAEYDTAASLGLQDHYQMLSAAEVARRMRVTDALAGLFVPDAAAIHPARLARGLANVVERRGATIYEQTPVEAIVPGERPRFVTPFGDVRAKTLVLAGESYLTRLPQLRRTMIPVYSLIVLTEPLTDEQWATIGWEGRELLASSRFSVDYLQRTADGRILFGGRGAPYRLNSRIDDRLDRHEPTHAMLRELAREWFPVLRDVRFSHAWGGSLGMPRDWMPNVFFNEARGVAGAYGYTGQGVSTANLSGRTLSDLITGQRTPSTALPTVGHRSRRWEPEPLRWAGIRFVQEGFLRLDQKGERTGEAPTGTSLVERLGRH